MQGGNDTLSAEELEAKKKSIGLVPEMNYKATGMTYELKGIENQNGTDYYVLLTTDGQKQQYDYYDVNTFMKAKTTTIETEDGQTMEQTMSYSDYKEVNGVMFAHALNMMMGEMGFSGTVTAIEVNGKIDPKTFNE